MSDEVMLALISLAGTVVGTFSGTVVSGKMLSYRVEQLEKKVEKHNNVIERVYRLEEDTKNISHQIEQLENKVVK